jgi:SPP1 gp7 family putative phage head morphogenesis protein
MTIERPWSLETLVRTQTQLAYGAGQENANAAPEIQEILWGYEYATVGDDRVRPTHAAMDGVRAPKADPVWLIWTPPNGYNCRCSRIEVFAGDSLAVPKAPLEDVKPDDGFAFNPGRLYRDLLVAA